MSMRIDRMLILFLIFTVTTLNAQNITGRVVDSKTSAPLPFANVFLNNTLTGSVSGLNGEFILRNIQPGSYELVISYVGYDPRKIKVNVLDADLILSVISVTPSQVELNTVEVKGTRDIAWERHLKKFKKIFLGEDKFAASCAIVNPWVIDFPEDESGHKFLAQASAPIEIINNALGYKIFYYLSEFWSEKERYLINGNIRFEEMLVSSEEQTRNWAKNREKAFLDSYNYLFKTLLARNSRGSGLQLYYPNRNEESIRILGYAAWVPYDTTGIVSSSDREGEFRISMQGDFEVRSTKNLGVSRLTIKNNCIKINKQGFVLNPTELIVSGTYDKNRIGSLLPISYQYENSVLATEGSTDTSIPALYEKIYVLTDKPYYYPGEPIWFKGYINYKEPAWRDSLSRVVYVELINPKKEVTLAKTLRIDSGFFHNDFILPDTLKRGTYYLRAYTNLNRNFGDSNLFVKPIPILNITDKVDHTQGQLEATENSLLTITSNKKTYKTREKITLTLSVKDKDGNPMAANLSISVTDAVQVVPIKEPMTIMNGYSFEKEKQVKATALKYPVEYGVGFRGKFVNDKGKPEKTMLTVLQMKPRNMMMATSNEQGIFSLTGFYFFDTTTFSFKADKAKDYPYGKVELLPKETPPMDFKGNNYNLTVLATQSQQRIISEYEVPKDAKMLEGVVVKGRKIEKEKPFRSYGYPDAIIKAKDINQVNILYSLAKLPGVFVDMTTNRVIFTRAATQSINYGRSPLVTIDDVPMAGQNAGEILSSLNPANIESIEITKRLNPLYGSLGASGVIAIYLKRGISNEDVKITPNFQLLKIQGYSSARSFQYPDYNDPKTDRTMADYRSTIYWNPDIRADAYKGEITVSFFAADLASKYRIVIEGAIQDGEAMRCVYFIEVEND